MGFWAGAAHPLSGLDHVLAMTTVGMLAATLGGRARLGLIRLTEKAGRL